MTDQELTIALAQKVMGWNVRLQDKGRCVAATEDGVRYMLSDVGSSLRKWNPLEDDADALMLVDAATKGGYIVTLTFSADEKGCWLQKEDGTGTQYESYGPELARAACEAIAEAYGIETAEAAR